MSKTLNPSSAKISYCLCVCFDEMPLFSLATLHLEFFVFGKAAATHFLQISFA